MQCFNFVLCMKRPLCIINQGQCATPGHVSLVSMDNIHQNICDVAQVWGGPRATKHTKTPPNEEAGLPTELS